MIKTKGWGLVTSKSEARMLGEVYRDIKDDERYHATIYTKPHCSKCKQTAIRLDMPKETRAMADYPDIREMFIEMGIKAMPVVVISKGEDIKDIWCDYQIDKIRSWSNAI